MLDSDVAQCHAPLVLLDRQERLWPIEAGTFIAKCTLHWGSDSSTQTVAGAVDPADLGTGATAPYTVDASGLGNGLGKELCSAHTRPFDEYSVPKVRALPLNTGFSLELRNKQDAVGDVPADDAHAVATSAPVYWAYSPGKVSYWFCYAGSGLPALVSHRLSLHQAASRQVAGRDEAVITARGSTVVGGEDVAARTALRQAHPDLYDLVTAQQLIDVEELTLSDIWDKLLTFVTVISADDGGTYLCHQGDWEHVTVNLNAADELGPPVSVIFNAHGNNSVGIKWAQLDKDPESGRFVVYSGRGSHASLARAGFNSGDYGDANGRRWQTWEKVEEIHQPWWGFGGAWGRVGKVSDLTGPLGPSPYKPDSGTRGQP